MKRLFMALMVLCVSILLLGCGKEEGKLADKYTFGSQVLQEGKSQITLALPFELKRVNAPVEAGKTAGLVSYGGNNKYVNVLVVAQVPTLGANLPTADQAAQNALNALHKSTQISDLKNKVQDVKLEGLTAKKIALSYGEQKDKLGVIQYIFTHEGTLWNVIYQYRVEEKESTMLIKEMEDKIKATKKEG